MVVDRAQLWLFFLVTTIGTVGILMDAPHIFEFVDQDRIIDIYRGKWKVLCCQKRLQKSRRWRQGLATCVNLEKVFNKKNGDDEISRLTIWSKTQWSGIWQSWLPDFLVLGRNSAKSRERKRVGRFFKKPARRCGCCPGVRGLGFLLLMEGFSQRRIVYILI